MEIFRPHSATRSQANIGEPNFFEFPCGYPSHEHSGNVPETWHIVTNLEPVFLPGNPELHAAGRAGTHGGFRKYLPGIENKQIDEGKGQSHPKPSKAIQTHPKPSTFSMRMQILINTLFGISRVVGLGILGAWY